MKTILTTVLTAAMTIAGHGRTAAPAAAGTFEQFWADAQKEKRADKSGASKKRMAWWRDARFGMFIHSDLHVSNWSDPKDVTRDPPEICP